MQIVFQFFQVGNLKENRLKIGNTINANNKRIKEINGEIENIHTSKKQSFV